MRLLSRKLLLCTVAVMVMVLFAGAAYAKGNYSLLVSDPSGYLTLTSTMMSDDDGGSWALSVSDDVVLTLPRFTLSGDSGEYIIEVSYDFTVISGNIYANENTPLTFYADYPSKTVGTADFIGMTTADINSIINSTDKNLGGLLVMTLTSNETYYPAVVVNTGEFAITAASTDLPIAAGGSYDLQLTVKNYSGDVAWEIISSSDTCSSYPVKTVITSSDKGHKASLLFTAPKAASCDSQSGCVEVAATDLSTGAQATLTICYDTALQLALKLSTSLISVDLNETRRIGLSVSGASGDVTYGTNEELWIEFDSVSACSTDAVMTPFDEFMEGNRWEVEINARDARGLSGDKRGIATSKLNVYVYGPLSIDVSNSTFTISSADKPDVKFTHKEASGDVSFDLSVSWAKVSSNKFVVASVDSSLYGTTQTVTVTAKDDRGRAGNSRGEATLTLNVTISDDFASAFGLSVSPSTITVNQNGTGSATLIPSNALGEVRYVPSESWASISGNTITVAYDSSYASMTKTLTVTATDTGRKANNTASVQLMVTFGAYTEPVPPTPHYTLSLTPSVSSLNVSAKAPGTINLSLRGAENSDGVDWGEPEYLSMPAGVTDANPLGLSFSSKGKTSAVLSISPTRATKTGSYKINISPATTDGEFTGGSASVTITVDPVPDVSISPENASGTYNEGDEFSFEFTASDVAGTPSWSITDRSWEDSSLVSLSFSDTSSSTVTLSGSASKEGTYSFSVVVSDDYGNASANVELTIKSVSKGNESTKRGNDVPSVTLRPASNLTPEMVSRIKSDLGLTASDEIRTLTSENILSPVSPDAETEEAMNQEGYLLAANLSRISVTEGGYYAFEFDVPSAYVNSSMNNLALFSSILGKNSAVVSYFILDAAVEAEEKELTKGWIFGTDGAKPDNAPSTILAVTKLEPNTTSGTFFASVVIPHNTIPELRIITISKDELEKIKAMPEFSKLSYDAKYPVLPLEQKHIGEAKDATSETEQYAQQENLSLEYKINSISVDKTANYVFVIALPDELKDVSIGDLRVMFADPSSTSGAALRAAVPLDPIFGTVELMKIVDPDSMLEKLAVMFLAQAGRSFSMYLCKILLMLAMGGCTVSYAGYGIIAILGFVGLAGIKMFMRR